MEGWEPEKQEQIWQRVMAPPGPGALGLGALLEAAGQRLAIYRQLGARASGTAAGLLRELIREEREMTGCLRGMARLRREADSAPAPGPLPGNPLERCCRSNRWSMAEYTARCGDPEFGGAFQELADRCRKQSVRLLRLLGGEPN